MNCAACALSLSWQSSGACRYCTEWLYFSCGLSSSSPAELCFLSFHLVKRLKILQPNNAERLSAVQGTPSANSWHFGTFRMDPSDGPLDSLDLNDRTFRATARPLCFFLSLSLLQAYLPASCGVFPFLALAFSAASCAMTRPFSAFNWETFTCRLLQVENAALHWNMHRRTEWRSLTQKSNKCKTCDRYVIYVTQVTHKLCHKRRYIKYTLEIH